MRFNLKFIRIIGFFGAVGLMFALTAFPASDPLQARRVVVDGKDVHPEDDLAQRNSLSPIPR